MLQATFTFPIGARSRARDQEVFRGLEWGDGHYDKVDTFSWPRGGASIEAGVGDIDSRVRYIIGRPMHGFQVSHHRLF